MGSNVYLGGKVDVAMRGSLSKQGSIILGLVCEVDFIY